MFERFTERARLVVALAQEEARTLRHNYIGTEHILLGLGREGDGVAVRILRDLDADAEKIRNEVIRMLAGPRRASHASAQTSIQVNPSAIVRRPADERRRASARRRSL